MTTITAEQQRAIAEFLDGRHIPKGLGTEEEACSIAAINLGLTGTLTDEIPPCMSPVIGKWIIGVQDNMPDELRNSEGWRELLPLAAGTGREHEAERLDLVLSWMWERVLPTVQPVADAGGFGAEWRAMCAERRAARAAWAAEVARSAEVARAAGVARAAEVAEAAGAAGAAWAAGAAARAARAAGSAEAAWAAGAAARAARAAGSAEAAGAAARAARAAEAASAAWSDFDPCGLLRQLIEVSA